MTGAGPSSNQPVIEAQPRIEKQQEATEERPVLTPEERGKLLGDSHVMIRDPILPVHDMQEACKVVIRNKVENNADHLKICQSALVHVVVPQVLHFPEMVEWCAQSYLPERKAILSRDGTREVISITPDSIASMLRFPEGPTSDVYNE